MDPFLFGVTGPKKSKLRFLGPQNYVRISRQMEEIKTKGEREGGEERRSEKGGRIGDEGEQKERGREWKGGGREREGRKRRGKEGVGRKYLSLLSPLGEGVEEGGL